MNTDTDNGRQQLVTKARLVLAPIRPEHAPLLAWIEDEATPIATVEHVLNRLREQNVKATLEEPETEAAQVAATAARARAVASYVDRSSVELVLATRGAAIAPSIRRWLARQPLSVVESFVDAHEESELTAAERRMLDGMLS